MTSDPKGSEETPQLKGNTMKKTLKHIAVGAILGLVVFGAGPAHGEELHSDEKVQVFHGWVEDGCEGNGPFCVRARDLGYGTAEYVKVFLVDYSMAPSRPLGVRVRRDGPNSISLSWSAMVNVSGFEYQQDGGTWQEVQGTANNNLVAGIDDSATYRFKVRAYRVSRTERLTGEPSTEAVSAPPKGRWQNRTTKDTLTNVVTSRLSLTATWSQYPDDTYGLYDDKPVLNIRCTGAKLEVNSWWGGQYVASSYRSAIPVKYTVDDGALRSGSGNESTNNEAIFHRSPKTFVKRLLDHTQLTLRVWNFDDTEIGTAKFPIKHLRNNLDKLEGCW